MARYFGFLVLLQKNNNNDNKILNTKNNPKEGKKNTAFITKTEKKPTDTTAHPYWISETL